MSQSHSKSSSSVVPSAINDEHFKILIMVILHNIVFFFLPFSVKFYPLFCGRPHLCFFPVHMACSEAFPSRVFDLV